MQDVVSSELDSFAAKVIIGTIGKTGVGFKGYMVVTYQC